MEPANSWERGEGWQKILALMEAARRPDWSQFTAERKERILQGVLAGVERQRKRRRVLRALAASACMVALVGLLLLRLAGADLGPFLRASPELADRTASQGLGAK